MLTLKATSKVVLVTIIMVEMSPRHHGNLFFGRSITVVPLSLLRTTQNGKCIPNRYRQKMKYYKPPYNITLKYTSLPPCLDIIHKCRTNHGLSPGRLEETRSILMKCGSRYYNIT